MDIQLDKAPCGYFSISDSGVIQSANQTFADMLRTKREELLDKHIETTLSVTNKMFFHTYFYPYIQLYGHVDEMYISFRTADSGNIPVLLNGVRQQRDGITGIDCVVVMMKKRIEHEKDILDTKSKLEELYRATREANQQLEALHSEYERKQQELIALNDQLETTASTDPLTGLRNRRFFQKSLNAVIERCRELQQPFSLLIIDIDHFKSINDTYGHPVGDLVLTALAQKLQALSGENDVVARYGGEEFVIILPGASCETALQAAEAYRQAAAAAPLGGQYSITISIGAATAASDVTEQEILHQADTALYAAKSGGRNRVVHAAHCRTQAFLRTSGWKAGHRSIRSLPRPVAPNDSPKRLSKQTTTSAADWRDPLF